MIETQFCSSVVQIVGRLFGMSTTASGGASVTLTGKAAWALATLVALALASSALALALAAAAGVGGGLLLQLIELLLHQPHLLLQQRDFGIIIAAGD